MIFFIGDLETFFMAAILDKMEAVVDPFRGDMTRNTLIWQHRFQDGLNV